MKGDGRKTRWGKDRDCKHKAKFINKIIVQKWWRLILFLWSNMISSYTSSNHHSTCKRWAFICREMKNSSQVSLGIGWVTHDGNFTLTPTTINGRKIRTLPGEKVTLINWFNVNFWGTLMRTRRQEASWLDRTGVCNKIDVSNRFCHSRHSHICMNDLYVSCVCCI